MRNDAFDELDDVPSLTTDAADRDEFGHHPRHVYEPEQRRVVDTKERRPASTGPLWALLGAMLIALAGVGWWSHQQISLMEQQLVATQESFVRISEEAAGRLDDIRGKVVASESSVTSEREALRLQVKQLQEKLGSQERQQADVSNQFGGQGKRLDQLASDLKAQQESAAQLVAQLDGKLQTLAAEQEKLKALQVELGKTNEQLKALGGDVAALKKQGNPSQTIKGIQDDLLVLRSQLDNRPAQGGNTAEFDAFRTQVMRNINTLQAQVQNLQQQAQYPLTPCAASRPSHRALAATVRRARRKSPLPLLWISESAAPPLRYCVLKRALSESRLDSRSPAREAIGPFLCLESAMSALQPSRSYRITGYSPAISNGYRQRLFSMGLLPGAALRVVRIAPLGDPIQVETRQTSLALRRKDLALLTLVPLD